MNAAGTIAVTGATGFIGARVVERLIAASGAHVRALTTAHGHLARLAVHPEDRLSWLVGDICDAEHLAEAFSGVDVVVHCAFGSTGEVDDRWSATVEGTAAVVAASKAAGVRRFVHLSTIDVYDPALEGIFDESAARLQPDSADREYEQQKLAAEELVVSRFANHVVLQPGVVYGPFGNQWTSVQLERLRTSVQGLPTGDGKTGTCNAIYIDDVADAVIMAATVDRGAISVLLNGPDTVTWGQFFDKLRDVASAGPAVSPPSSIESPEDWELELYQRTAQADASAAIETLGWRPATTLDAGMRHTERWYRWMHQALT